jgi:hypothetical protein
MSARNVVFLLGTLLIVLAAAAPIISVAIASALASSLGCRRRGQHPSLRHIGHVLYTMFVLGWLGIATIPSALSGLRSCWSSGSWLRSWIGSTAHGLAEPRYKAPSC